MTTYWPSYYKNFHCLADKCQHTCCTDWVIGIDDDSLERFSKNEEICSKIADGCFVLKEDGRCPFLRDDNLCSMIIKYGEDYLCEICKEHPRFYNTVDDHIEAGIGLVCEEACRLVLDADMPFELCADDGSKMELPEYVSVVFDESKPLTEILMSISGGKRAPSKLRTEIFNQMEVLDQEWSTLLSKLIENPVSNEDEDSVITEHEREFRNFAAYLLYRYAGVGRFTAESTYLLADLVYIGCGLKEIARVFSCEVEYSDINIEEALETFA